MAAPAAADDHFLRDLSETRAFQLGRPVHPLPTGDGKAVLFLRAEARSPAMSLYETDLATGKTRRLLAPDDLLRGAEERLSAAEKARRERQRVTARGLTSFELTDDERQILLPFSGKVYLLDRASGKTRALAPGAIDPTPSPDGTRVAFVRDRDLWVADLASGRETRLTLSTDADVSNGLAEFVAQEEMDRSAGFWWSPDGSELAYEEADARPVEKWTLADPARPGQGGQALPYPRPGKANVAVRLGVIAATGGPTTWIEWDHARYPYLCTVRWKHGPLTVKVMARDQRSLELLAVAHAGGKATAKRLLEEHDPLWLNLDQSAPRWIDGGKRFLWTSEQGGAWRIELRRADGALDRVLATPPGYAKMLELDEKGRALYLLASPEPSEDQVLRLSLDDGTIAPVSREPGIHTAVFPRKAAAGAFVLTSTTLASLPRSFAHRPGGPAIELPSVAESPPFQPRAVIEQVGPRKTRAVILRPRDFDPSKRYAVVLDVYGGPHHRSVEHAMGRQLIRQWLADLGYVVVAVDGRGTPRRGREWERAIAGDFTVPLAEQIEALDALGAAHHELDLARVGVFGWSFGGYLAALAVLERGDRFRAAVAGAPVCDWTDYDTFYTERYLGLLPASKAAYDKSSLIPYAANLARPLLIVHGTSDDNVYFVHSLKLAEALFRAGKPFELVPLPGLTHQLPDPVITERLYQRIAATFAAALK